MPLEFTEVESRDSSRKRILIGALAAIIGAAVIGAAGVFATIALLNAFASDTVQEIEDDHLCPSLLDIAPPDPAADGDAATDVHAAFQEEYLADLGPDDGWWGSGITHLSDGFRIIVFVERPADFAHLPNTYEGVDIEVCREGPIVPP